MMCWNKIKWFTLLLLAIGMLAGCTSAPTPVTKVGREYLSQRCRSAIVEFKHASSSMSKRIQSAYAYAVFPSIGAGALGIGGAAGRGEVFCAGQQIGYCKMTQVNIGAQIGGQTFAELILFRDKYALSQFESGLTAFDARATAVAAASGSGTSANYQHGVVVFTMPIDGLMAQAAIGGQHFSYAPAGK
jgi:lipid-binding SYLF domain-containing protein